MDRTLEVRRGPPPLRGYAGLAAALALGACGGASPGDGAHVADFPVLVADPVGRIGDQDDPDVGFSRIGGVDVDRDGNVYVLEGLASEIRVYGPEATLLRRIGGAGGGPGEFQSWPLFGVVGDTVWAVDRAADRITLFDRRGALLSTGRVQDVLVPLPSGFGHVRPRIMRPDGTFTGYLSQVSFARGDPPPDVKPTDSIPVPVVRFDPNGHAIDTIGWLGRPPPQMWRPPSEELPMPAIVEVAGRRVMAPAPPSVLPRWLPLADGYVSLDMRQAEHAEDGVFTLTRIGLRGDTLYHRAFHYRPIPYTPEDLDSIAAWSARGDPRGLTPYAPGQGPPPDWEVVALRLRAVMEFPDFQLPVEREWMAQDGGIWLRTRRGADRETADWLLFDPEGKARGRLELPVDVQPRWSRGDTVWAVQPDAQDVPWLVRFEISGPS